MVVFMGTSLVVVEAAAMSLLRLPYLLPYAVGLQHVNMDKQARAGLVCRRAASSNNPLEQKNHERLRTRTASRAYRNFSAQLCHVMAQKIMTNKIIEAIWECDAEEVKILINDHPEAITSRDEQGRTLLSQAAERGCIEIVAFLVDKGADINSPNLKDKFSPLHSAIMGYEETDVKTALYLIDHGANLQALDIDNRSPLDLLAYFKSRGIWDNKYEEIANKIIAKTKKIRSLPTATAVGTIQDVIQLTESGYDLDSLLFSLKLSVFLKKYDVAKHLLSMISEINSFVLHEGWDTDWDNKTVLDIAIENDADSEFIKLLKAAGAETTEERMDLINQDQERVRSAQNLLGRIRNKQKP